MDGSEGGGSPEDSPTEIILRWDSRFYDSQIFVLRVFSQHILM
jgi:hypothetical protein